MDDQEKRPVGRPTNEPYYKLSEEGKQAAILHTKAWLGIA